MQLALSLAKMAHLLGRDHVGKLLPRELRFVLVRAALAEGSGEAVEVFGRDLIQGPAKSTAFDLVSWAEVMKLPD